MVFLLLAATIFGADGPASRYGMKAMASYKAGEPSRPTVCLVHGMNSSTAGFVHVISALEAAGFGVVSYDYPYNRDLDRIAPGFGRDWKAFRATQKETRPWAILSHSMGALLAREYVEGGDYGGDVSDLLLIAPPNRGSAIAQAQTLMQLVQFSKASEGQGALAAMGEDLGAAAKDLEPGSAFLKRLNARPRRRGVRYHILAGDVGFLNAEARARIDARLRLIGRAGLLGGAATAALGDVPARLDALTDGRGDGCVGLGSTELEGVEDREVIHANHVELIRGPMLYPDPGPVACMPFVLKRLAK